MKIIDKAFIGMLIILGIVFAWQCEKLPPAHTEYDAVMEETHFCNWKNCEYNGAMNPVSNCIERTDCLCIDQIHFEQPELTYEQCDSVLYQSK